MIRVFCEVAAIFAVTAWLSLGLPAAAGATAAALAAPNRTTVGLAKGTDYAETVRQAVAFAGGLSDLVKPGMTVFIKPNIVAPVQSGIGHITDYRVLQEVVNLVRQAGAKRIIIGEHTNPDDTQVALATSGIGGIKGVEFLDTNTRAADSYTIKARKSLTGVTWAVPKAWVDADVVISVPVLKTHASEGVTLSLKNVGFGIPLFRVYSGGLGWKQQLHEISAPKTIADICQVRRIDFAIIDAMVAGEGEGPGNPTPRRMNVIIAGRDPVAVDTIGTTVMGIDPQLITHLSYCEAVGLGTMDRSLIDLRGASLASCRKDLVRSPNQSYYAYKMTTYVKEAPEGLVLDGNTAEWRSNRLETMSSKSAQDCSAGLRMGYRDGNLYIAGDVTDDKVVVGKDSVSVYLSMKNPFDPDGSASRRRRDVKLDFELAAAVPKSGEVVLKNGDGRSIGSAAFMLTNAGYQFEAVIPLKSLNLSLAFGEEFWVDLGITDVDGADDSATTYWGGPGNKASNPTTLGRAICMVN